MESFSLKICSQLTQCLAHIPLVYQTKPDSLQWFGCGEILAKEFISPQRRPYKLLVQRSKV
jgi:hypothetical protein